ncbi:MAG: TetM/TetW/TetO/TetS family tetracycline resistance ribosomal protection protein [Firmicutes bacterium]|nr:TetM/TetW/TetO/TetS family tetracycline resistance ribosomal protection protein [Bacillota bacterium]
MEAQKGGKRRLVLGIFAQVDAGKTTLSEALLYKTGALRTLGRVDHGDAHLDTHELERARGITIFSKQARFETERLAVTLLDTPGHADFAPEAERVMPVIDCALLLVSGTDGVQGHTLTLWRLLQHYGVPVVLFFNKMDLPGADRAALLADARTALSDRCAALDDAESVALSSEALLEHFLNTGALDDALAADAVAKRELFACLFGSARQLDGIDELLQALERLAPVPVYPAELSARVYQIAHDLQGNRLTFLKVTGGTLAVRSAVRCHRPDGEPLEAKVTQLRLYSGAEFEAVQQVPAGDVCAALGLSGLLAGDTLGDAAPDRGAALEPVMSYCIRLPADLDPQLALPKLRLLEEEEPQLRMVWDARLREIRVQLMGAVQLEILQSLIRMRFGWDVTFDTGRISYRETIAAPVEGVGHFEPLRHYAEVHLILAPLPQGSGLVFDTVCSEDVLDRNWQRLILTHLQEKQHLGVLTGSPVTDLRITLAAGRAHLKHTEGGDFRQATYRAVRQGLMKAESILLEPYYAFRLTVPPEQIGRAISDIRAKSGSFDPPVETPGGTLLQGRAPVSELRDYARDVAAYTRGRGRLSCEVAGYFPCHNTEAVVAALAYDPAADLENTPDSVFCSHGAGITIPWDQVEENMHLESVLRPKPAAAPAAAPRVRTQNLDLDEKELQRIIEREFGPQKTPLYRPPAAKAEAAVTLPPRRKEYLIVDGYNMIFAWDGLREQAGYDLSGARERLLDLLSNYCGFHPCELIVVFDSYRVRGGTGSRSSHNNLRVVYTQEDESADLYIETLVGKIGKNYAVRVATSDALIQLSALRSGVLRVSAAELERELERTNGEIAAVLRRLREEARHAAGQESPLRALDPKSNPDKEEPI